MFDGIGLRQGRSLNGAVAPVISTNSGDFDTQALMPEPGLPLRCRFSCRANPGSEAFPPEFEQASVLQSTTGEFGPSQPPIDSEVRKPKMFLPRNVGRLGRFFRSWHASSNGTLRSDGRNGTRRILIGLIGLKAQSGALSRIGHP